MKILRFILPFIFVRNWYSGDWEISRARSLLFAAALTLVLTSLIIAYVLQSPIMYSNSH